MKCKKAKRRLSAFMDNGLKEKEGKEMKVHLEDCSSCSEELKEMSFSWGLLLNLKPVEPPLYLIQKTIAEVAIAKERLSWWQEILLRPATVIATVALGILIGGFLGEFFHSYFSQTSDEFVSSISLDSFSDFPEGSAGRIIFIEEEG